MQLGGYLEKVNLGADPKTGLPNILVESASEYHALPAEDKRRAWALVKVATELLHLGPVTVYQQAAEGKLVSKTIKKNAGDRKGLTFIQIESTLSKHTEARKNDKERVLRRLKRVLRGTWWFNSTSEFFLLLTVANELNGVEAEEFGTPADQDDALIKRHNAYTWLADTALSMIKDRFGPEEAARIIQSHVASSNQLTTTNEGTHEGNDHQR